MEFTTTYGTVIIESLTGTFGVGDTVVVRFRIDERYQNQYIFNRWLDGNTDNPRTMVIEECGLSVYPVIACRCQDDCNKIKLYQQELEYFKGDTVIYIESNGREFKATFWECLKNRTARTPNPGADSDYFSSKTTTCCGLCDIITPLDYRISYEQGEIVIYGGEVYYCVNSYPANTCSSNAAVINGIFFQEDNTLSGIVKDNCGTLGGCKCDEYLIYMSLEELIGCRATNYEKWDKFTCQWVVDKLEDILKCNNNTDNNIENQ